MRVRVLGCSGAIAKDSRTTSFLIDGDVLIDAGTGVGDLTLQEMRGIRHVLLTHSHLDHIAALPLMVDSIASQLTEPIRVCALPGTSRRSKTHRFQQRHLARFQPHSDAPGAVRELPRNPVGQTLQICGKHIEVCRRCTRCRPALRGDRGRAAGFHRRHRAQPAFWRRINQMDVAALVIGTAFSNREKDLAAQACTCRPALAEELDCIDKQALPHLHHAHQAGETELIMTEIQKFDQRSRSAERGHDIRWLRAGQEFDYERRLKTQDREQAFFDRRCCRPTSAACRSRRCSSGSCSRSPRASTRRRTSRDHAGGRARTSASS
jgi:hypothetical protein